MSTFFRKDGIETPFSSVRHNLSGMDVRVMPLHRSCLRFAGPAPEGIKAAAGSRSECIPSLVFFGTGPTFVSPPVIVLLYQHHFRISPNRRGGQGI